MTKELFYTEVMKITDPVLAQQMANITQQIHLAKNELLIRHGERQEHFVFLLEGVLRGFFLGQHRIIRQKEPSCYHIAFGRTVCT